MKKKEVKTTEDNQFPVAVSLKKIVQKIKNRFDLIGAWKYHCAGSVNNKWTYIKFNWLALIHYKRVTEWYGDIYKHTWRECKSIFSRKWIKYEHQYFLYSGAGDWNRPMTEEAFEIAIERASNENEAEEEREYQEWLKSDESKAIMEDC